MDIYVVGINHKTGPVEVRESVALSQDEVEKLRELISFHIRELAFLSTCNRVEFYLWGDEEGVEEVFSFLERERGVDAKSIKRFFYIHRGQEAVRHIFRVASSLDSMVLGEPQIVGQFKDAFEASSSLGLTGTIMNNLLSKALATSKKVRTKTGIGESAVSVSYAAVELASKIFGELEKCTACLIGAGEMAELAAMHLRDAGVREMLVVNRTLERARALAERLNAARSMGFDHLEDALTESDIVITSTASPTYIITKKQMEGVMKKRKQRPIFLIDIAVPRDVDPEVEQIDNIYLYNIDDLEAVVEENRKKREREAEKAEVIVAEQAEKFMDWLRSQEIVPVIVNLRNRVEEIRKSELQKTLSRLNLGPKEEKALNAMTSAIVNKILHPVFTYLKQESAKGNARHLKETVKALFALEECDEAEDRHKGK